MPANLRDELVSIRSAVCEYVDWHGALHVGDCPEDDTCDCDGKPVNDSINAAIKSLDALLSSSSAERTEGWQPIETAPKDGTPIIVADGRPEPWGVVGQAEWRKAVVHQDSFVPSKPEGFYWSSTGTRSGGVLVSERTRWMPIPSASALDQEPTTERKESR